MVKSILALIGMMGAYLSDQWKFSRLPREAQNEMEDYGGFPVEL